MGFLFLVFGFKLFTHMLQSLILLTTESDPQTRLDLVQKYSPVNLRSPSTDLLLLADPNSSLGIDSVRSLQEFFATKPAVADYKVAILFYAYLLTPEAQSALLKTLEEPPEFARIILVTPHTHQLLPTILSRCQVIRHHALSPQPDPQMMAIYSQLAALSPGQKLSLTDTLRFDRVKSLNFTENLIHHFRNQLHHQPGTTSLFNLTLTLYTTKLLRQNVHPKLVLDYLFLNLKSADS